MNRSEKLPSRLLGSSGIAVSAIGLGCMSLSGVYGTSSDDDGIALIRDALDRGLTFLDTSDAYGAGHNETLVAKPSRDDAVESCWRLNSAMWAGAAANLPMAVRNSS